MVKRFFYGALMAVVIFGLVLVVILKKTNTITHVTLFDAIPGDAVIIMENIDYEFITEELPENKIWADLLRSGEFASMDSSLALLKQNVSKNEELNKILDENKLNLSWHLVGKDKLQPIIYIDYAQYSSAKDFTQFLLDLVGSEASINERRYEAEMIYDIVSKHDYLPDKFSFTCTNGLCLISPSSMLVEEAIRVLHSDEGFTDDLAFRKVLNTSGRYVHANIYINYEVLNQLFYPFVDHARWNDLSWLSHLAQWGELDVDVKNDAIIMNGMTHASDSLPLILAGLSKQSPVKIEITDILPSNTFFFLHLGIDDKEKFQTAFLKYLADQGERIDFDDETERLKNTYRIEPFKDLLEILDNEIAWLLVEGSNEKITSKICVIESKSQSLAKSKLQNWHEQYLRVNMFEASSLVTNYRLDNQTSFEIYRLPDQFYLNQKAGNFFDRYYTIYDKYILFGPTVDALSAIIYQNILHKTLVSNPVFEDVLEYFSDRSNISIFLRPYKFLNHNKSMLNEKSRRNLTSNEELLKKIPGMVLQYSNEDDLFYNNVVLKYSSHIKERALTEWESLLDTTITMKPSLVINHNTSEKEIFLQDAGNKVYLINGTGRILWNLQLDSPVLGDVYQIDFYKNNKLQLLFNTKEKLHLIDRNGNYVERYPVNLRVHATNPMALFDYDNSRDYRIFVAGTDRKIYLYDKEGNIITDWKFKKTEDIVSKPLQHFRINDKDYILAMDPVRTYILDRRGRERVKLEKQVALSDNNQWYLDMNIRDGKPRWISTDTEGNILSIFTDGKVKTILDYDATPDHYFRIQDMDRDGIPDFIIADNNELKVLKSNGERMFTFKTKEAITLEPDIYKFSTTDIKIGLTNPGAERIYLVNADGSLHEGFPLEGNTRFSIGYFAGSDSRFNLIVGSSNSFLYNYSIE